MRPLLPIDRIERHAAHHPMDHSVHFNFNSASFAPREGRLHLGDDDVILEQKVANLLHAFCRRPGQVLTKTWLMEEIWPGRVVNEDSLSVAVSKLRRVLGDRAAAPKYIRTVTGTGYIWLPETRRVVVTPEHLSSTAGSGTKRWLSSGLVGVGLLVAGVGGWWISRDRAPAPETPPIEAPDAEVGRLLEEAGERLDSEQPEILRQAIAEFREALEQDPDSAKAYLGIAEAKLELSARNGHLDIELYADETHALLDRVIELDPDNARAWLRKAELHWLADWDFQAAEHAYLRAIELDPNDPTNYLPYSEFLLTLGEFERSEEMLQQLREADPAAYRYLNMSFVYTMRGELERALAETRRLMNSESESDSYRKMLHRLALLLGDEELAFEQFIALMREKDIAEKQIAEYTELYRQSGLRALFSRLLEDRVESNIGHYQPPMAWARYAVVAERHDEAFRWLNQAVDERQPQVLLVNVDPHYLPLRNDPRFAELLDRLPQRAGDSKSSD
ncbi:tetratricopeptide repeat protein [Wenzhouxiangella sp. XN201]|uniref:winged helix-turn-helix domain-containing protein n=1 Tax=Wenzhouxiangella sp. XN201 TaxID=2710755 RepID=UPI0013C8B531|nr:winged helix-turn-helix domain-containing protein [Wenzhouxiangella sp. XN201]NEZ03581.1 tetratricopeptide repeat protein [Wenzhouxiangella sp. XN201]